MIKRILNFDKQDWKHLLWLMKTMLKNLTKCDFHEVKEGYYFIKLHLTHDSTKLN